MLAFGELRKEVRHSRSFTSRPTPRSHRELHELEDAEVLQQVRGRLRDQPFLPVVLTHVIEANQSGMKIKADKDDELVELRVDLEKEVSLKLKRLTADVYSNLETQPDEIEDITLVVIYNYILRT